MAAVAFLPADLIICSGSGWLDRAIEWAERSPGEGKTYAVHAAGFTAPDAVTEALWTVRTTPYAEWKKTRPAYEVWRCTTLSDAQRAAVAGKALAYVGRRYGVMKIAAHLGDKLLSDALGRNVYAFRRLARMDRYPICSWVWAEAYSKALGLRFGVDPSEADPDDMLDYVSCSPKWAEIYAVGAA